MTDETVEVIQADRDAAAKLLGFNDWEDATDYRLSGRQDAQVAATDQAFARHRLAFSAPPGGEREDIGAGNRDCLAKRRPGEPMFILLGRDPDAHNIVRSWASRRRAAGGDPEHYEPVYDIADAMQVYAAKPENAPASAPSPEAYPPVTVFPPHQGDREAIARAAEYCRRLAEDGWGTGDIADAAHCADELEKLLALLQAPPLTDEGKVHD
jgi:hypothetical protein